MYNVGDKNRFLQEYAERIGGKLDTALLGVDLGVYMADGNDLYIRNYMKKVKGCFDSMMPEGIPVPKVSMYVTPLRVGDTVKSVSISITNRVSSDRKFKFTKVVAGENVNEDVVNFFKYVYNELLVDYLIGCNLDRVNVVLNKIAEDIDLPYNITIVAPLGGNGKIVSDLSDEEVCFVADPERVFNLGGILVFQEVNETITESIMQKAISQVADELVTTQTPEQLIGIHGGILIQHMCNISRHMKPMTMIKKVCNRNVENYHGNKQVLTYFKEGDIFSLLMKVETGYEVVLSPFNTTTLRKEDFDVVARVKELTGFDTTPVNEESGDEITNGEEAEDAVAEKVETADAGTAE